MGRWRYWICLLVKDKKRDSTLDLQATKYYFVYYINTLQTGREEVKFSHVSCHSFMVLNRVSDVSAADWLSQNTCKIFILFHVWR